MQNKLSKYFIISSILVVFNSCEKSDFLQQVPLSFTTEENYYKSIGDFEAAISGCYAAINMQTIDNVVVSDGTYSGGLTYVLSAGTDELITQASAGAQERDKFGIAAIDASSTVLEAFWKAYYAGIMRCNLLLKNAATVHLPAENAARLKTISAEARFLRGFYYYHLAAVFGAVPLANVDDIAIMRPRESLENLYKEQIIPDLIFAYENLENRGATGFAANKWTAGGFLAVVYNYLAAAKKYNAAGDIAFPLNSFDWVNDASFYAESRKVLENVVQNSGYKLIDRYDYLFRETTKAAQKEECLLLAENATQIKTGYPDISSQFCPQGDRNTYGGSWGTEIPTVELYNAYRGALDKRLAHNITSVYAPASAKETIEGASYYIPTATTAANFWRNTTGKFRHVDPKTKTIPLWASGISTPLLRYADLLLHYAEALYATGDEVGARDQLSKVRQRSLATGKTIAELNSAYNKTSFIDELLDERRRELCYESKRRIDLFRFGRLKSTIMALNPNAGPPNTRVKDLQANWRDADYRIWMPLPNREIRLNKALIQNTGY